MGPASKILLVGALDITIIFLVPRNSINPLKKKSIVVFSSKLSKNRP